MSSKNYCDYLVAQYEANAAKEVLDRAKQERDELLMELYRNHGPTKQFTLPDGRKFTVVEKDSRFEMQLQDLNIN